MPMAFEKIRSADSDYIVVNKVHSTATDLPAMARRFCPQGAGVGANGFVLFSHQGHFRFVIRYFGPDGRESPADDNALRSCARVINCQYGYQAATLVVGSRLHEAHIRGKHVGLRFPPSRDIIGPFDAQPRRLYGIWTGSDNIVAFTENIDSIDPEAEESVIRRYSPAVMSSASINFVEIHGADSLRVRTFDPGVGAEVVSSGTGVLAAAAVARRVGLCCHDPVEVRTWAGCSLTVQSDNDSGGGTWLYGPAVCSFWGELPCP